VRSDSNDAMVERISSNTESAEEFKRFDIGGFQLASSCSPGPCPKRGSRKGRD
jgi:hypothetical protein